MITLGISLYPEQESMEDIEAYLDLASRYGFTKVFTSVFSVPGTVDEVVDYFKGFTAAAHQRGMKVTGDVNAAYFDKLGATPTDLSVFKRMGLDVLRMDMCFMDKRDAQLINNREGIGIEMSTGFVSAIDKAIENGADVRNLSTCHNFFPERYTGSSPEMISAANDAMRERGIPVALFITSQQPGTHGPWPVSNGLPTIEDFRTMPVADQVKFCLTMGNVDEILFGDAFASEAEFAAVRRVMDAAEISIEPPEGLGLTADFFPHGEVERVPFDLELEPGVTDIERKVVFDFPSHTDVDCCYHMIRSRFTRITYGRESIPARTCCKEMFEPGDVLVVNDNLAYYRGECQICMKPMVNDGQRNLIGRISEADVQLLGRIKPGTFFTFLEKEGASA